MRNRDLTGRRSRVVRPDTSPEYPDSVSQQDLAVEGLTLTVPVRRSEAVVVAGNSVDGNAWSASVVWQDNDGNVTQTEGSTDVGLDAVTEDWARLIRKGPVMEATFTDESAAAENNLNVYIDTYR